VSDATGAVIPGASIHVVQQGTNVTFNTKTNGVGFYQVPSLFTGTYVVTATAPKMKTYETTIELLVAQTVVINPKLALGEFTERMEVTADVVQLTTLDSGTISSTLENARINQLPMNGRNMVGLVGMTVAGVEGGTRSNGLEAEALEYVADGVTLSNRQFGGMNQSQAQVPDPDAVQEVRVETSNTSAMYTEPATAILTTKSGSNSLHGALFETSRNNGLGIAKQRQDASNKVAPQYIRNEFGASAGGPITLPKLYNGKDKSFWFLAYERYSLASAPTELVHVPTPAMRGGDFSQLTASNNITYALFDPATTYNSGGANCPATASVSQFCRTQFPNNQIPISRLSPTSKVIFDITPLPSTASNPLQTTNLATPNFSYTVIPTWTFRLDHAFNENNRAYLRYTSNLQGQHTLRNYPSASPATVAADGLPANASGVAYNPTATYAAAIGFTHVFSPTFYSETVASQQWFSQHNYAGGNPNLDYESMLGLPNNFGESGFPNFGANLITPIGGTQFIYGLSQIVTTLDENLSKTFGKHQMKFGGRYRREGFGDLPDEQSDTVTFTNQATGIWDPTTGANLGVKANTGYADGDMFLGAAASYGVYHQPPYQHFSDMELDAYYQDDFHATKNLTLNLGLRYEAHPAPNFANGLLEGFDLKNDAAVLQQPLSYYVAQGYTTAALVANAANIGAVFETPSQAGMPNSIIRSYNLTLSPRVGFAYTPFDGKRGTVIRGAYGRYTYPIPTRSAVKAAQANFPFVGNYNMSYTSGAQSPDGSGYPNYLLRAPQLVTMGVNSANVVNSNSTTSIARGNANLTNVSTNFPPDFVTQVSFTVEQSFKDSSALRVSWVWAHGTNLDRYFYYNAHPSTFVWEAAYGIIPPTGAYSNVATGPYDQTTWSQSNIYDEKNGWSNDNSLQASYQKLFHRGIAYQVNYVWSRPLRMGGNSGRDSSSDPAANYLGVLGSAGPWSSPYGVAIQPALPPARPAGVAPWQEWHALDKFEGYYVDYAIPLQHLNFNAVVDLPFGRGKRFFGNANRLLDEAIGGFQLAGSGTFISQAFMPNATNAGPTSPIQTYKHKIKVTDCRSGACVPAYQWFNGYIAPTANGNTGLCPIAGNNIGKCLYGIPSNYTPYQTPIDNTPGTTNYGNNNVQVNLANGTTAVTSFIPGPINSNPFGRTIIRGPYNYEADLSLFKVFPITGKTNLRFNMDAFNAFNIQGFTNPDSTSGIEQIQPGAAVANSYWGPRQVQLTLRLQF
jgi:hypothetical protein